MSNQEPPTYLVQLVRRAINDAELRASATALLLELQTAVANLSPETLIATAMMGQPEEADAIEVLRREIIAPFQFIEAVKAKVRAAETALQPLVVEAAQRVLDKTRELESVQKNLLNLRREQVRGPDPSREKRKWMMAGLSSAEVGRLIAGNSADRQEQISALEKDEARLAAEIEQLSQFQKTLDTSLLPDSFAVREPSIPLSCPPLCGFLTNAEPVRYAI